MMPKVIPENEKTWEKIDWSAEHMRGIYRDWGKFHFNARNLKQSEQNFTRALEMKADDAHVLQYRSRCKRKMADMEGALEDSLMAAKLVEGKAEIENGIVKCLYELNRFEDSLSRTHDNIRKFTGSYKAKPFLNRLDVLKGNFNDNMGKSLGHFMIDHEKVFLLMKQLMDKEGNVSDRPLWKILKEQGKCDVQSILDEEEDNLTPLQIARRERTLKVVLQTYFNKSWEDVYFVKALLTNPSFVLHQSNVNAPILHALSNNCYDLTMKFLKMLQSRSPWYDKCMRKCPIKKVCKKNREIVAFRHQYATRRNPVLQTLHAYRRQGRTQEIAKLVEKAMGDYVVLKTHRVLPFKFEVISDVYNLLALSYCDRFTIPKSFDKILRRDTALMTLLRLRPQPLNESSATFVFGKKSTHEVEDENVEYKRYMARLEKRIRFTTYDIERCYLFYEIARTHLHYYNCEECVAAAIKSVKEAQRSKSIIWQFLSVMLICKSHTMMKRVERLKETLDEAYKLATLLKSKSLCAFVKICSKINDAIFEDKIKTATAFTISARSKSSFHSSSRYKPSIESL